MPYLFRVNVEEFFTRELLDVILLVADDNIKAEARAKKMYFENNADDQIECSAYLVEQVEGYKVQLAPLDTFYFTFGSSELYPFQGGWIEVIAPSRHLAFKTFKKHYPNREGSPFINCCDCYESADFKSTDMFTTGNLGAFCHAVIKYEEE